MGFCVRYDKPSGVTRSGQFIDWPRLVAGLRAIQSALTRD